MKNSHFVAIIILIFFSACNMDKMFLFPEKLNVAKTDSAILNAPKYDTLLFSFSDKNFQPLIRGTDKKPFDLGYNIESVIFENGKGKKLNAWFLKPKKQEDVKATILFLHGNAGNVISHFCIVHPLVLKGYQVLLLDYSGFGFSEGKATRKNVLIDAQAALNYLKTREDTKNLSLVVYGQSLGGNLAPEVARRNQNKVDALVIEGAFSSHDDISAYATNLGIIARIAVRERYSATHAVKKFHKPILIIHSKQDKVIPFFMGENIYIKANEPKFFYAIDKPHINGPIYYADSISYKIQGLLKINAK